MKVILLEGDKNCGKTRTLNLVYAHLINSGYECVEQIKPLTLLYGEPFDFTAVVTSSSKKTVGKKTVAIVSHGDVLWYCEEQYQTYLQRNYDVLIMAFNTSFKKRPAWYNDSTTVRIQKMLAQTGQTHLAVNTADCNKIISNI